MNSAYHVQHADKLIDSRQHFFQALFQTQDLRKNAKQKKHEEFEEHNKIVKAKEAAVV